MPFLAVAARTAEDAGIVIRFGGGGDVGSESREGGGGDSVVAGLATHLFWRMMLGVDEGLRKKRACFAREVRV